MFDKYISNLRVQKTILLPVLALLIILFYLALNTNEDYSIKRFAVFPNGNVIESSSSILRKSANDIESPSSVVKENANRIESSRSILKENASKIVSSKSVLNGNANRNESSSIIRKENANKIDRSNSVPKEKKDDSERLRYILQWTPARSCPFVYMGQGRERFIEKKCPYTNCFVTDDRNYFRGDMTKFDVIAFNGPEVIHMFTSGLPRVRSPWQKYVFASIESSDYYPICSHRFDGYFNWTWTFRLDSEVKWGYMNIRDKDQNIVGPQKNMNWIKYEDMAPVSDEFKEKFRTKTRAAAWFVSNCYSKRYREQFVKTLQEKLKKYDLTVDIYGQCGPLKCSRDNESACFDLIKEKYHFYLSFENSFSEDYVTEKLLNAVQNDAIPIVYGAANYSRFLPEHSYLNARELGAEDLAAKMNHLLKNPDEYFDYFRWTQYYSYHRKSESVETDEYCLFCTILNNERLVKEKKVYQNFREWWDPPNRC